MENLAKLTELIILEDTNEKEIIQYRRTLLRLWPDYPSDEALLKAKR